MRNPGILLTSLSKMKNDRSVAAAPVSDKDNKLIVASEVDLAILRRRILLRLLRLECLMVGLPTVGTDTIIRILSQ